MSYRGRPSKGCESCRARKVKCDETKPVCSRCSKSGHECKYRDQADLLFRNQTAFAAQRAEESWRKRSKSHQRMNGECIATRKSPPTDNVPSGTGQQPNQSRRRDSPPHEPLSATTAGTDAASSMLSLHSLSLHRELTTDLRRLAYERFVYDFVVFETPNLPHGAPSDAMWDFIPTLYGKAADGSCLSTAIDAVSYANFANRCNAPHAQVLAQEALGKSIKLLQKAISDKKQALTDEALCSVYLLGVYENLTIPGRGGSYLAHKEGANALLGLRTIEEFYSNPISARLYEVSFAQMLIGNLQSGKPPALPIRNSDAARPHLPNMYSASGVYVVELIQGAAQVHAKWMDIKRTSNPPSSRQELQGLLKDALELDADFQAWESTLPRSWRYVVERNTPEARSIYELKWRHLILDHRGAPEEIHTYSTLKRCWLWMFYRTSRIFLLRDLLEILNWMFRFPEPDSPSLMPGSGLGNSSTPLDNTSLHIRHAFATNHLVNVMEKTCAAIMAHFTVPVYGKSPNDTIGMRAYTSLWCLGVIDAVLRHRLVPDSSAPPTPPSSGGSSPSQQYIQAVAPVPAQLPSNYPLWPPPDMLKMPIQNMYPMYTNPSSDVPQLNTFSTIPHSTNATPHSLEQRRASEALSVSAPTPPSNRVVSEECMKKHIFDSAPNHPFSFPTNLPAVDFPITKPACIDVAARREWLNRLLFFIAMDMGIKKGIAVPATEGYLEICKAQIGHLIGK